MLFRDSYTYLSSRCLRADYSIIVATRPEPTVLPPSRFFVAEIIIFLFDFWRILGVFVFYVRVIFCVF